MDVVVTVPKGVWQEWLEEGDLPGEPWSGNLSFFNLYGGKPRIQPGERVYVVAHGKLRGYAPLIALVCDPRSPEFALIRHGDAVAVTIQTPIRGFRGWRYRTWQYEDERPFPEWRTP